MKPRQDGEIVNAFHRIHANVMFRVFPHMVRFLKGQEVSFQHLVAMFRIKTAGPQSIAAIASEVELTQTAASRMVERLVRAGLLDRAENPGDRRQKLVTLTDKGAALLAELPAITMQSYEEVLSPVSNELVGRLAGPMAELCRLLPEGPGERDAAPEDEDTSATGSRQTRGTD